MKHRIVGALALLALAGIARAAAPTVTLTGTPQSGAAPASTTLTWSSTSDAVSCTASGGTWTGTKATSGTEVVSGITVTTAFKLDCSSAAQTTATISWTAPTQRVDNTPITGPLSYAINYGLGTAFDKNVNPPAGTVSPYTITGLAPGNYSFRMQAVEGGIGVWSDVSNVVARTITGAQVGSATFTFSVASPPKPPTILTVTVAQAFQVIYDPVAQHYNVGDQFGTATLGAVCDPAKDYGDGWFGLKHPILDSKPWKGYHRTKQVAARCG